MSKRITYVIKFSKGVAVQIWLAIQLLPSI